MSNEVNKMFDLWKEKISDHIQDYSPFQVSRQLKQMAALFAPGSYYYYVFNFQNFQMDFVNEGTKQILGIQPDEFTMKGLLERFPPEELKMLELKEKLVTDFLFGFLNREQLPFYKVVYFFRAFDQEGRLRTLLNQTTTLTVSNSGKVEHVLGVHTDVTELVKVKNDKVSFLSLREEPSYYDLDPEETTSFHPDRGDKKGSLANLFSKRELEILKLISEGMKTKKIAQELSISENTIRTHRKKILLKSECSNMTELVTKCLVEGVI